MFLLRKNNTQPFVYYSLELFHDFIIFILLFDRFPGLFLILKQKSIHKFCHECIFLQDTLGHIKRSITVSQKKMCLILNNILYFPDHVIILLNLLIRYSIIINGMKFPLTDGFFYVAPGIVHFIKSNLTKPQEQLGEYGSN